MNTALIKTVMVVMIIILTKDLNATNYYIALTPTGNDNNAGSKTSPFASLEKANNIVNPGDTVFIMAGNYNITSQVKLTKGGSSGAHVVYKAYSDQMPVFDFTNCILPPASANPPFPHDFGAITIYQTSYVIIDGISVQNSKSAGIQIRESSYSIIKNCYTYDTYSSGISAWDSEQAEIDNNILELACNTGPHECISISRTSYFTVSNNEIKNTTQASSNSGGEGIDVKEASKHGKLFKNYVHNLWRQGLYVDSWNQALEDIEWYENIVHDCMFGFCLSTEQAGGNVSNVKFHHNIIYNCPRTGIVISTWGPDELKKDISIYNNTIYNNGWKRAAEGNVPHGGLLIEASNIQNMVLRNNIFSKNCSFQHARKADLTGKITVDYNLLDDYNDDPLRKADLSYFPAGTSGIYVLKGSNQINGNPQLQDASQADFHLLSNSAAINAGNPNPAYNDPDGSRNDIGAFPYSISNILKNISIENDLELFPQPIVNGTLTAKTENTVIKNYCIFNIYGVSIESGTMNNIKEIDCNSYAKGIYVFCVWIDGKAVSKIFMIR